MTTRGGITLGLTQTHRWSTIGTTHRLHPERTTTARPLSRLERAGRSSF
jgi:hypothetical protein